MKHNIHNVIYVIAIVLISFLMLYFYKKSVNLEQQSQQLQKSQKSESSRTSSSSTEFPILPVPPPVFTTPPPVFTTPPPVFTTPPPVFTTPPPVFTTPPPVFTTPPEPVNCIGRWEDVSVCNATTNQSVKLQKYVVDTPAMNGGSCQYQNMTQTVNCPVDCTGEWVDLSVCNVTTVQSTKRQRFMIFSPAMNGGNCQYQNMIQTVNCPVDCTGRWEDVNICNATTNQSTKLQKYVIDTPAMNGGSCQYQNMTQTVNCPVDCIGDWVDTNVCNVTTVQTIKRKRFMIFSPAMNGGSCQYQNMIETVNCPVDCTGRWEDVAGSVCNITTSISFKQQRYVIDTPAMYGGSCQYQNMTQNVNCPVDCIGEWKDVTGSVCNPTTSISFKQQLYVVNRDAMHGGKCTLQHMTQSVNCPVNCSGYWVIDNVSGNTVTQKYIVNITASYGGTCITTRTLTGFTQNLNNITLEDYKKYNKNNFHNGYGYGYHGYGCRVGGQNNQPCRGDDISRELPKGLWYYDKTGSGRPELISMGGRQPIRVGNITRRNVTFNNAVDLGYAWDDDTDGTNYITIDYSVSRQANYPKLKVYLNSDGKLPDGKIILIDKSKLPNIVPIWEYVGTDPRYDQFDNLIT